MKRPAASVRPAHTLLILAVLASMALLPPAAPAAPMGAAQTSAASAIALERSWESAKKTRTQGVAWGDVDGDGDLDLAVANRYTQVGNPDQPTQLYYNEGGTLQSLPGWEGPTLDNSRAVVWGDIEGDGDLDLAVANWEEQPSRIYLNTGAGLSAEPAWDGPVHRTNSVAWGDLDGDGVLDLALGSEDAPYQVFRMVVDSQGALRGELLWAADWDALRPLETHDVAWGDMNNDGCLDLAASNWFAPNQLYIGERDAATGACTLPAAPSWSVNEAVPASTNQGSGVAWGDVDGDGYLDLAVVGGTEYSRVYRNVEVDGRRTLEGRASWSDNAFIAESAAWGDADGDGDLDLAVGNNGYPSRIYINQGGLRADRVWIAPTTDNTESVAWGDMDGDGDLDLATGNGDKPNRVYRNETSRLDPRPTPTGIDISKAVSLAWGDVDGDGDLDLAVGSEGTPNAVYRNEGGALSPANVLRAALASTTSVAWGDVDGDGDLDLAVGNRIDPSVVYLNNGLASDGSLATTIGWSDPLGRQGTQSVAWGDADGDGDLDLALGNSEQPSRVYRNEGGRLGGAPVWSSPQGQTRTQTTSVVWGDVDGDGDLDLAISSENERIQLYRNDAGTLTSVPIWQSYRSENTHSLAWGDVDGDGDLDLVAGNYGYPSRLYENRSGALLKSPSWSSYSADFTESVALGDMDGDGDLDLAVGNNQQHEAVYRNEGGQLTGEPVWRADEPDRTESVAWGDVDGDGDLDLLAPQLYINRSRQRALSPQPIIGGLRPLGVAQASHYADARIAHTGRQSFSYTLAEPSGWTVPRVTGEFSLDGGGHWLPAVATSVTMTHALAASPEGVPHIYEWDVLASGVMGQSDNVVFRLSATPGRQPPQARANRTPGPFMYGGSSATTLPFRSQGRQVRVLRGGSPVAGALVYRLPAGAVGGGRPITDHNGLPFSTDGQGLLQGRATLRAGDQLMALAHVGPHHRATIYHTSARPNPRGLDLTAVTVAKVQQLTVSADNPLALFDLHVALEWQADQVYRAQLESYIARASQHLYDFTDGQAALGRVTVSQNADDWAVADVVVHASNSLRPYAVQGGSVMTATTDWQHPAIIYQPGQVHMGATWNRYGLPGQDLDEDWSLTLAHELSHYLFFLDDTYLGLRFSAQHPGGRLIAVDTCTGSAMGDVYDQRNNTEFVADRAHWRARCAETLSQQLLRRTEWETITGWYGALRPPAAPNPGPSLMPMSFTSITVRPPITPTATLTVPILYLDYDSGQPSSEARAFLLRDERYVIDLGGPQGGLGTLVANDAQLGDRVCVFDRPRGQYGCETLTSGDDRLAMVADPSWQPIIMLTPVNSRTLDLVVGGAPQGLQLRARIYPELGEATKPITLSVGPRPSGRFLLDDPALSGIVQVWAEGPAGQSTRREVLVPFAIGGNPGYTRTGGGYTRTGGGYTRTGGGYTRTGGGYTRTGGAGRSSGAPLVSPDGQLIFFTAEPDPFQVGEFYTVQSMAGLPPLPPGKRVIGQSYRLVALPATLLITGSVSFQYRENDLRNERADEADLNIAFWNGQSWEQLDTLRSTSHNLASAQSRGQGTYALLAGVTTPQISALSPTRATSGVATTMVVTSSALLPPLRVVLSGASRAYTLTAQLARPDRLSASLPSELAPGEYRVTVVNGDGGRATAPKPLVLSAPTPDCFAESFDGGLSEWDRTGSWGLVQLAAGSWAVTDSPQGSYAQSERASKRLVTAITSPPFNINRCGWPLLQFQHHYALASVAGGVDAARVEISVDGGKNWAKLAAYSGTHSPPGVRLSTSDAPEWRELRWETAMIDLKRYRGVARLRFSLDVNSTLSERGWLIDNIRVVSQPPLPR